MRKKKRTKNEVKQLYRNEGLVLIEEGQIVVSFEDNIPTKARVEKIADYRKKNK